MIWPTRRWSVWVTTLSLLGGVLCPHTAGTTPSPDCTTFPHSCGVPEFNITDCFVTNNSIGECDHYDEEHQNWPGEPRHFQAVYSNGSQSNSPGVVLTWQLPTSHRMLTSFQLSVIYDNNHQYCRKVNFRRGLWDTPPYNTTLGVQKIKFEYGCLTPEYYGTMYLFLRSNPRSHTNYSNTVNWTLNIPRPPPPTSNPPLTTTTSTPQITSTTPTTTVTHTTSAPTTSPFEIRNIRYVEEMTSPGVVKHNITFEKRWTKTAVPKYEITDTHIGDFTVTCPVNQDSVEEVTCTLPDINCRKGQFPLDIKFHIQPISQPPSCICDTQGGESLGGCIHSCPETATTLTNIGSSCSSFTTSTILTTTSATIPTTSASGTKGIKPSLPVKQDRELTNEKLLAILIGLLIGMALVAVAIFLMVRNPSARNRLMSVVCKVCNISRYRPRPDFSGATEDQEQTNLNHVPIENNYVATETHHSGEPPPPIHDTQCDSGIDSMKVFIARPLQQPCPNCSQAPPGFGVPCSAGGACSFSPETYGQKIMVYANSKPLDDFTFVPPGESTVLDSPSVFNQIGEDDDSSIGRPESVFDV